MINFIKCTIKRGKMPRKFLNLFYPKLDKNAIFAYNFRIYILSIRGSYGNAFSGFRQTGAHTALFSRAAIRGFVPQLGDRAASAHRRLLKSPDRRIARRRKGYLRG